MSAVLALSVRELAVPKASPVLGGGSFFPQSLGSYRPWDRSPKTRVPVNAAQAARPTTSTGPSGFLLSRTGTTPGNPGATSTQLPPFSPL
jgi:hypothetical protein